MLNETQKKSTRRAAIALVFTATMLGVAPLGAQQRPQGPTLRLSMQEAEAMALETNLGLKQTRIDLDVAAQNIAVARSAFLPSLRSSFSRSTSDSASQSFFESTGQIVTRGSINGSASFAQLLPWYGAAYQTTWTGSRSTTTAFTSFNPQLGSTFRVDYSQPLLRNFKTDSARARLQTSEMARHSTDLQVQEQVLGTQAAVRAGSNSAASSKAASVSLTLL